MGLADNVKRLQKRAEGGGNSDFNRWKPESGINKIVLMPGYMHDGKFVETPFVERGAHFNSPNGEVVNCPRVSAGKKCRLCEAYKAAKDGDGPQEDLKTCKVNGSFSCLIIDRKNKSAGVQVWDAPWSAFNAFMGEGGLISDPSIYNITSSVAWLKRNPVIQFVKKGKKLTTEYDGFRPTGKRIPMSLKKYIKKGMPDLKSLALSNLPSYEDTQRAYDGEPLRDKGGKGKSKSKGKGKKPRKPF